MIYKRANITIPEPINDQLNGELERLSISRSQYIREAIELKIYIDHITYSGNVSIPQLQDFLRRLRLKRAIDFRFREYSKDRKL